MENEWLYTIIKPGSVQLKLILRNSHPFLTSTHVVVKSNSGNDSYLKQQKQKLSFADQKSNLKQLL